MIAARPYYQDEAVTLYNGDALEVLRSLPDGVAQTCVTSPPYWGGVRDYGARGQMGLERRPETYVAAMTMVFRVLRETLRPDGALWLNVGDVYAAGGKGGGGRCGDRASWSTVADRKGFRMPPDGYKMKDLTLVAHQLAASLRADGWYLRATIVWKKPAAVEPMRLDRPAVSHEYLFLLTPNEQSAVRDPGEKWWGHSVWEIPPEVRVDHPATMPSELARRCIAASTPPDGVVLDPFAGAGTTLWMAKELGRRAVGIELNPDYCRLIRARCSQEVLAL